MAERTYLVKITTQELVDAVRNRQEFVHQDIYNFGDQIKNDDPVFIYFSGDKSKINWPQGLVAIGRISKSPYDQGYGNNERYFRIKVQPLHVLDTPIAPQRAKLHDTLRYDLYDVPYVGANHFPNQAIAQAPTQNAQNALAALYLEVAPDSLAILKGLQLHPENAQHQHLPNKDDQKTQSDQQSIDFPSASPRTIDSHLVTEFVELASECGLIMEQVQVQRLVSSMLSKRFVILSGLAGSGKTKIAQAFAYWLSPSTQAEMTPSYAIVPVGADWMGNENILGYPDGLQNDTYVTKPALELIRQALKPENATVPHFLILDEMNLSHVERYFADILSAIESGADIPLYEGKTRQANGNDVPQRIPLPDNLFIIGTVNVDETTYMFSPKVLDRANVLEFRVEPEELTAFLASPKAPNLPGLSGKGSAFGPEFVTAAKDRNRDIPSAVKVDFEREMLLFFNLLREHNVEFGYRTAYEAARLIHFYHLLSGSPDDKNKWFDNAMDAVIIQKFLPKLHGSRSKMEGLLWALAWVCGPERTDTWATISLREVSKAQDEGKYSPETLWNSLAKSNPNNPVNAAHYPLSFEKVMRMWRKLVRDQFVSFPEA